MTRKDSPKTKPTETDFGTRAISNQNFSKMVAIPKQALANCCQGKAERVNVKLVQNGKEKFLKLTPICSSEAKP